MTEQRWPLGKPPIADLIGRIICRKPYNGTIIIVLEASTRLCNLALLVGSADGENGGRISFVREFDLDGFFDGKLAQTDLHGALPAIDALVTLSDSHMLRVQQAFCCALRGDILVAGYDVYDSKYREASLRYLLKEDLLDRECVFPGQRMRALLFADLSRHGSQHPAAAAVLAEAAAAAQAQAGPRILETLFTQVCAAEGEDAGQRFVSEAVQMLADAWPAVGYFLGDTHALDPVVSARTHAELKEVAGTALSPLAAFAGFTQCEVLNYCTGLVAGSAATDARRIVSLLVRAAEQKAGRTYRSSSLPSPPAPL